VRLRALVVEACGEKTLTCTFRPGGRKFGEVGIRSHFYCEACGGSALWHEVAEGIRTIETAEEIIRASRATSSTPIEEVVRHGECSSGIAAAGARVEAVSGRTAGATDGA
jgi:hypothetical protein